MKNLQTQCGVQMQLLLKEHGKKEHDLCFSAANMK